MASLSYLVDNLDKVVNGNLVHFTSVILVADRKTAEMLDTEVTTMENELHDPGYLKLTGESREKYLSGAVFVLGHILMKIYPLNFGWVQKVLGSQYRHTLSKYMIWYFLFNIPYISDINISIFLYIFLQIIERLKLFFVN